jgi:hypothetical protein
MASDHYQSLLGHPTLGLFDHDDDYSKEDPVKSAAADTAFQETCRLWKQHILMNMPHLRALDMHAGVLYKGANKPRYVWSITCKR